MLLVLSNRLALCKLVLQHSNLITLLLAAILQSHHLLLNLHQLLAVLLHQLVLQRQLLPHPHQLPNRHLPLLLRPLLLLQHLAHPHQQHPHHFPRFHLIRPIDQRVYGCDPLMSTFGAQQRGSVTHPFTIKYIVVMAESKEAMQNTIKNLQAKSDYIYKLEDKGSKTIVLQLGSHSIKMGFANEKAPFTVSPFVAYRRTQPAADVGRTEEGFDDEWFKEQYHRVEETLKQEGVISPDNRPFKGKPRAKQVVGIERIPPHSQNSPVLFGDEALRVQQNPGYIFRKIITHGALNVAGEWQQGERMGDLQNLLVYLLKQKIKIPQKEWNSFNCILIVGDVFVRRHVKMLVGSLFKRIGFRKLYIHLESIMACFGTAVSSACVVDIGHEKISVCCVDQGVILPKTLIRKNFGSKDISKILAKIFNERISDPAVGQLKSTEADLFHLDRIKEIACAVREPEETINRIYEINPLRNGSEVALQIAYSDTICVASNSFFSEIWNAFDMPELRDPFNPYSRYYDLAEDPEDYFEEFSGGGHVLEVGPELAAIVGESICDPFIYQSLQEIVLASLLAIKDSDIRRKFTTSILIIGGGAHMPKLSQEIMIKLNAKFEGLSGMDERAEMATDLPLREIAPIHASWLGGTVIPKLDSLRDLWIERGKFLGCLALDNQQEEENMLDRKLFTRKEQSQEWGIRYLKEKVPFIW